MKIVFKTKYRTFVKVQYGKWNANERKSVTVYKSTEGNCHKVVRQGEGGTQCIKEEHSTKKKSS